MALVRRHHTAGSRTAALTRPSPNADPRTAQRRSLLRSSPLPSTRSKAPLWRAVAALLIVVIAVYTALTNSATLGLDLSGGTQLTYEAQDTKTVKADAEATDRALEILRGRVDSLGVSEPTLTRSGENRIIIELPGEQDPEQAKEVIGTTAQLTFHPVTGTATQQELNQFEKSGEVSGGSNSDDGSGIPGEKLPDEQQGSARVAPEDGDGKQDDQKSGSETSGDEGSGDSGTGEGSDDDPAIEQIDPTKPQVMKTDQGDIIKLGPAQLGGDDVTDASAQQEQEGTSAWVVAVDFSGSGGDKWEKITTAAQQYQLGDPRRRIAIVLDGEVISSPEVQDGVQNGGSTQITGDFSNEEADDLATLIKGGSLPVPIEPIEERVVGPTLGDEAIDASIEAAIIGIAITGIFILFVYRLVGLMATIALASYAAISYAMLVMLGATLTLPGLAGFVLSIGMAIDANVLIFERAREEYEKRRGEGLGPALDTGYRKAWSAIIDSNVTTLLAGALLFFFATGPVKGFGVTLSLGVIASMISALLIARVLTDWLVRRAWARNHPSITGIGGEGKIRNWLNNSGIKLMKRSTTWLAVSAAIVIVAIGGMLIRGMNLGVEFTGGRVLEYSTTEAIDVDDAREAVADAGFPQAVVQESGNEDQDIANISVRTDEISDDDAKKIEGAISSIGEDVVQESATTIEPTLGEELRNKALIAFGIAVAAQMIYLAFRFRWTWALAAVLAMVHDVVAVVGIFAWWDKPIDGVFLAAILSIIGLSVNDTIVVFDRIRERRREEPDRALSDVTSDALLQTLPRTINTGLGAMFILGALAFLGGASLTDFSLALLLGLGIGIFSSIFTASPLALLFERIWPAAKAAEKKKAKVADPYANVAAGGREGGEI
ncbi:protein translocase subunit SecD [Solicola gregarius]|uniref:Multifunctional fusion protein n=1 Tax=Solicola gregarius TaxID=2908642 RepID=A0AA46YLD2_9ACTN|nr:protein translocase subunit SecD [Solicola gregarius]UYM04753.1 protein translocase subunit SecD [Solicola gregarius]